MLLYSRWLALSLATRNRIAQLFNIPKTGATEVVSNEIKSDGYDIQHIESALTAKAMNEFLKTGNLSLEEVWTRLVSAVEGNEIEVEQAPVPALDVLPPKEAIKADKEYKARVKKVAKPKVAKPKAPTKKNAKAKK
jgi:hypothetical protein